MNGTTPVVMLVEDEDNDVILIRRAFTKAGFQPPQLVLHDGDAALSYLQGQEPYTDREAHPLPGLILLDIKLPRRSGLELLEEIGQDARLRRIPVVVLTSSSERGDIQRAYGAGANSYLVKPVAFEELQALVEVVGAYWLKANRGPVV